MVIQESPNPNPPPSTKRNRKPTAKRSISGAGRADGLQHEKAPFEFCEVCKLNHDQGRRHKYFPSHIRALAVLLDRLRKRLVDVRCFLRDPSALGSGRAARNSLWCAFCSVDIRELDNSSCMNAIYHLASAEHGERVEEFLRKHGGGIDRLDDFRITETDLRKWEKACTALEATASLFERPLGPLRTSSKDIQHDFTSSSFDKFAKDTIDSFSSNASPVIPLQSLTNEDYRQYNPVLSGPTVSGSIPFDATLLQGTELHGMGLDAFSEHSTFSSNGQQTRFSSREYSTVSSNGQQTCVSGSRNRMDRSIHSKGKCSSAWEDFHHISCPSSSKKEVSQFNDNNDAAPPWIELSEETSGGLQMGNLPSEFRKPKKLNPNRVGAAWAEKRKAQLEREKNGEIIIKDADIDANWLPNFGRVWQAGTRKESRKEFEIEKRTVLKINSPSNQSFEIQPYISKRMRVGSTEVGSVNDNFEENIDAL